MYSKKSLLIDHNYSLINNKDLKNIEVNISNEKKKITLSGVVGELGLKSPNYGTFSNIRVDTNNHLLIKKLVTKLFEELKKKYESFQITFPPFFYNKNLNFIKDEFIFNGASVEKSELNNHIDCRKKIVFSKGNKKKLNKLIREKFTFHKGNISDLKEAYNIIKENRSLKGNKVSLTYLKLKKLVKTFNKKFNIWLVYNESKEAVASAITIDLIDEIRYVFYWGDKFRKDSNSPIVLMANELIKENIKNNISRVDLGTSSVNGIINPGLKSFKNSIGAMDSPKITIGYKRK